MGKEKIYALICLASLLLFFQSSVLYLSDLLISYQVEETQDLTDTDFKNRTNNLANPLEEEILHSAISIQPCNEIPVQLGIENGEYSFKMKTSCKENTTPPPKHA